MAKMGAVREVLHRESHPARSPSELLIQTIIVERQDVKDDPAAVALT